MRRARDQDPRRYAEDDERPFSLNWDHYVETHKAIACFSRRHSAESCRDDDRKSSSESTLSEPPRIPEENRLLPSEGYFAFYSDLLGFSKEISLGGMDSLPDYFGAALAAALRTPGVQIYLLSDSCIAFAPSAEASDFVDFVTATVSSWLSNGLIPQCVIGYGSFVERKPFAERHPPNFFGTQITGTALPDAVNFLKAKKPSGSRILLTDAARSNWPPEYAERLIEVGRVEHEFIPQRDRYHHMFDCLYYLLCLREHEPGTPTFDHYAWSFASRAVSGGIGIPKLAVELAAPFFRDGKEIELETIVSRIKRLTDLYDSSSSPA